MNPKKIKCPHCRKIADIGIADGGAPLKQIVAEHALKMYGVDENGGEPNAI